ncbi:aladin-like [Neodiprion virginianus]|uniref:aladin-like n=1 Tax=Neodiprion virginianus TaxID=2961670 RepID=UPI001EE6FEE6|nr:aladin-like [Neodiprion virginianus]XP_046606278.1 aladin-like [Neodiprion virginianus]XP_046606287.1 aladin-like [Neodiprion virginianus]
MKLFQTPSLEDFKPPLLNDEATVGLVDGSLRYVDREHLNICMQSYAAYLLDHPNATVSSDMLAIREAGNGISAKDMFLPVQESALKKIASVWRDKGFIEAVHATAEEDPAQVTKILHWVTTRLSRLFDLVDKLAFWNEGLPMLTYGSAADIAITRDWATAIVRCLAWHPHCTRLALATRDDRIRVFCKNVQGAAVLRHSFQKSVSCLTWRPNSGRELAAACQMGILIWKVELGAASSSLSQALTLRQRGHAPVTSVAWNPQGDLLVSCSPANNNMYIWDTSRELAVPLKCVRGGGLCFARWSHCGSRLLAASTHSVFRIWNTGDGSSWKSEKWMVPNGRVAAACFGPDLTLLFVSTEVPEIVFSLPLQENIFDLKNSGVNNDVKAATAIIDLKKTILYSNQHEQQCLGGRVIAMEWDPTGKYLAIIFRDSPIVVVFAMKLQAGSIAADAAEGCLIKGFPGEVPNCMNFQQDFDSNSDFGGACLTIAWSSGRVQHFPLVNSNSVVHSSFTTNHLYIS